VGRSGLHGPNSGEKRGRREGGGRREEGEGRREEREGREGREGREREREEREQRTVERKVEGVH